MIPVNCIPNMSTFIKESARVLQTDPNLPIVFNHNFIGK